MVGDGIGAAIDGSLNADNAGMRTVRINCSRSSNSHIKVSKKLITLRFGLKHTKECEISSRT